VTDKLRGVLKDSATRRMIGMTMTVKNIAHGHTEAFRQFTPQPRRKIHVNGIGEDDSVVGYQKQGVMAIILRSVKVFPDRGDAAFGRPLRVRSAHYQ
jgi:hypothetical protein